MGAGICCCAQHEFIEQGGVVDLQKVRRFFLLLFVPQMFTDLWISQYGLHICICPQAP